MRTPYRWVIQVLSRETRVGGSFRGVFDSTSKNSEQTVKKSHSTNLSSACWVNELLQTRFSGHGGHIVILHSVRDLSG